MGKFLIGIRRETKNIWEKRVPLVPGDVKELREVHGIQTVIQPSEIRIFKDREYIEAGAVVKEDLSECSFIFGVKEMPKDFFESGKTYIFFSHTIKGQPYNMPMLKRMMELGCTLIDYERIVDNNGRRLIFFGRHAGYAGMIDALWILGKRLEYEGVKTPFSELKQALSYNSLEDAKTHIKEIGEKIKTQGLPWEIVPLIIGITGYGNVSQGAQEILNGLPVFEIHPESIREVFQSPSNSKIYKVVFKEEHMVVPREEGKEFELLDYYNHPEKYRPVFEKYLPYLSVLVNAIYWDSRYPRFVTKEKVKELFKNKNLRLKLVADISCDIEGAIEFTVKCTESGEPTFVYNPVEDTVVDGYKGDGIVVLAVDNLPAEIARESSIYFSSVLKKFVPEIVKADYSRSFEELNLPGELKRAVILYKGKLTPDYRYLEKFVQKIQEV